MAFYSSASRTSQLLSATSSTRCPDQPSSTLRARLRSPDTSVPGSSSPKHPAYPDVYRQFRACFDSYPSPEKTQVVEPPAAECNDAVNKLRESFAQSGMKLHALAMEKIVQAHDEIQAAIDDLVEESSVALSECDALYSNIAYPLSATICHSDNFPRATIGTHLGNMKREVDSGTKELEKLEEEWNACVQNELEAWKKLTREEKLPTRARRVSDVGLAKTMNSFKEEAVRLVEEKCRILSSIEREYKANIKQETMTIMQSMLDDST